MSEKIEMNESLRKWLEKLPPDEADRLRAISEEEKRNPNPVLVQLNQLYKRVREGTASPEEMAEYNRDMSRFDELTERNRNGKFYDDSIG